MARTNTRLEAARTAYRDALEAARAQPSAEAWARLLAAGKELSAAQEPRKAGGRKSRRAAREPIFDMGLGGEAPDMAPEVDATME
jgi:hypothetical protein